MFGIGKRGAIRRPAFEGIVTPQSLRHTADWQTDLIELRRQCGALNPEFVAELRARNLLTRCSLLVSDPDGPLVWKYIAAPTIRHVGADWARSHLGRAHDTEAALGDYSRTIQATYNDAAQAGEVRFNHVVAIGIADAPVSYGQLILPFQDAGRTALLIGLEAP